jgi:hypothetical protein
MVGHAYNPYFLGDGDRRILSLRPTQENLARPSPKNEINKRDWGVVQVSECLRLSAYHKD